MAQAKPAEKKKANIKYLRDKDRELVKGIFVNHEKSGAPLKFVYYGYEGDPIEKYTLEDGHVYSLPLGVARHINTNTSYPVHAYTTDENGKPVSKIGKKIRRFSFQSLEFTDIEGVPTDLVTIEAV